MKWFWRIVVLISLILFGALSFAVYQVRRQGLPADYWQDFERAQVVVDANGIPTIEAASWEAVFEAQGYVVASDRFFHMDLLRRAGAGRLAELFGPSVVEFDRSQRQLDPTAVADREYEELPERHRRMLDAYTRGVNAFLSEHGDRAGLEYRLLGERPEPWKGRDSLLVILSMNRQLSRSAGDDALRQEWKAALPEDWFDFLFPQNHPWNEPMFGEGGEVPPLPTERLPQAPLSEEEIGALAAAEPPDSEAWLDPPMGASNNWVYCRKVGCFVANDPHLGATVPQIWYASRLRVSAEDWVVGVGIPGLPGVVLGMNPEIAWAFTNAGEDVDDWVEEKLSSDGTQYFAGYHADGSPDVQPVRTVRYQIEVRGASPVEGEARFTHRGPLSGTRSRQWLPLKKGMLRLPLDLPFARDWDEFNRALDEMRSPAQNVVFADRAGNHGYRASGTGVRRRASGLFIHRAPRGEWDGYQPWSERPRRFVLPVEGPEESKFIATANERIWVDEFGHPWGDDLRKDRIRTVLSSDELLDREDMTALQLDTVSRFSRLVLRWVADRARPPPGEARSTVARWGAWSGAITEDAESYADARIIEKALAEILLGRVRRQYLRDHSDLAYRERLDSAWMIRFLEEPGAATVFGIDERALADALLARAQEARPAYAHQNRWRAQHPFARAIPVLGKLLFEVPEIEQIGGSGVPRVERPKFGASCRLVWDLRDPKKSTWSLPVGQSGHAGSPHYADLMVRFQAGESYKVFDPAFDWGFGG